MEPSLLPNDTILINKFAYIFQSPQIGDIVIVKNPQKDTKIAYIVKRIWKKRKDTLFLLGDNKYVSVDSRSYGWVSQKMVIGKMIKKLH